MNQPDLTTAPPSSANDIETVARQIAVIAREMSSEIDNDRRLPEELVALLGESGLLRAGAPAEVRGLELPPGVALRCAEAVARGNASAGWCVSIAITSSLLVAYLPASSRDALFGDGRGVAAGVWAPRGTARTVDGGVVVSGRWPFCSGIIARGHDVRRLPGRRSARAVGGRATQRRPPDSRHLAHAGPARHRQPRHGGR